MEKDKKEIVKKGYINKYHLIYPLIIMSVIVILLTSFVFKTSDYAGSMLSFAATLSSVLLAVIAIIITLIDATGQRNNISETRQSVQELREVTDRLNDLTKNSIDTINEKQKELLKITDDLIEKTEMIDGASDNEEEHDEKIAKLKEELSDLQKDLKESKTRYTGYASEDSLDSRRYVYHPENLFGEKTKITLK